MRTTTAIEAMEPMLLHRWLPGIVVLVASVMAILSQYPALVNPYVINGDVPIHIYWMQQFVDEDLFKDDFLTEFAKAIQPHGLIFIYRMASFVMDPLMTSKILPIALFIISAVYMFKLVQYIGGDISGMFAASIFVTMPEFLGVMVGGTARAFGYPLMIIFLYYLIKADYLRASFLLILQALFYPVVLLLSLCTYGLTLIRIKPDDVRRSAMTFFILASIISASIAATRYLPSTDPLQLSRPMTRIEMGEAPEYTAKGRFPIVPVPPLAEEMLRVSTRPLLIYVTASPLYLAIRKFKPEFATFRFLTQVMLFSVFLVGLFFVYEVSKRRLWIPKELIYLFAAGALSYKLADLLLFRLYLPDRYLDFSIPLLVLILVSITLARLIAHVTNQRLKSALTFGVIVLFLASFNMTGLSLFNLSANKNLYSFLNTLPKNTLIAAPPYIADYIPTFSKRKVFINRELAQPWSARYWGVIKTRTRDFFQAYYAGEEMVVSEFSQKHRIDYLVVDKRDFLPEHLANGRIYFEPFGSEVRSYARMQQRFALLNIPETDKLFVDGNLFVVSADVFNRLDKGSL